MRKAVIRPLLLLVALACAPRAPLAQRPATSSELASISTAIADWVATQARRPVVVDTCGLRDHDTTPLERETIARALAGRFEVAKRCYPAGPGSDTATVVLQFLSVVTVADSIPGFASAGTSAREVVTVVKDGRHSRGEIFRLLPLRDSPQSAPRWRIYRWGLAPGLGESPGIP